MPDNNYPLNIPGSYIRVQTNYYKKCLQPTIHGEYKEIWMPWSAEMLKQDLPRSYFKKIQKFDGFSCMPSHLSIKTKSRPGWVKSTYLENYKEEKKAMTKQDSALSGIWDEYYEPDKFKEKKQKQTLVFNLDHQGPRILGTLIGDDNPNYPNLPEDEQHDLRKFVVNGNLKGSLVSLTAIIDSDKDKGHIVYLLEVKNSNSILEGITIYYDLDEKVLTTARTKLVKRKDYFSKGLLK